MPEDNKKELTRRFMESVEYLNRQIHSGRLGGWEALEMTIPQIKTLVLLERMGPLRMGTIALHFDRALSATTAVVDRLVEKNLVHRRSDPKDRRLVICELTDVGKEAMTEFWRIGNDRLKIVADTLDAEDLEKVVRSLELIRKAEPEMQRTFEAMHSDA